MKNKRLQLILVSFTLGGFLIFIMIFFGYKAYNKTDAILGIKNAAFTSKKSPNMTSRLVPDAPPTLVEEIKYAISETPPLPLEYVFIKGGTFLMGTNSTTADDNQTPAHNVTVESFDIGKYPVTNFQFKKFLDAFPDHNPPLRWKERNYPKDYDNFPVVNVDWNDARDFAKWVNARLCSEEEWEYAARGKTGYTFAWGNEFEPQRSNLGNVFTTPTPVFYFKNGATKEGVFDMTGNVWEWTSSQYKPYPGYNPQGRKKIHPKPRIKVLRGASYSDDIINGTLTARLANDKAFFFDNLGFRLCRDPQ